ncbi:hypothetical protein ACU686_20650 [Yinghuangia aomiensis]
MRVRVIGSLIGCHGGIVNPGPGTVLEVSEDDGRALVAAGLGVDVDQAPETAEAPVLDLETAAAPPPVKRGPGRPRKNAR